MRYISKVLGIYLAFLAQTLIFENIKIFSCSPDILITAIIICAVSSDYMKAAALGAFGGMLVDVMCKDIFGINILIYMYLALLVSLAVGEKTENSPLLMSWVVFISIAAMQIILGVFKSMLGYSSSIGVMGANILVKGMFASVFTLLFVLLYQNLKKKAAVKRAAGVREETI